MCIRDSTHTHTHTHTHSIYNTVLSKFSTLLSIDVFTTWHPVFSIYFILRLPTVKYKANKIKYNQCLYSKIPVNQNGLSGTTEKILVDC